MGKTLKVAFAMGGGASLGAFSGGAIAEVIRQLHANVDAGVYDRVEVDVLSGASAGGMTVGLLLRSLADPLNRNVADAVQRVDDAMRTAWVDRIDITGLVSDVEMSHRASLFDRGAVDAIASDLLSWAGAGAPTGYLLGPRVCLGLTLLNYNGIPISMTSDPALQDSLATTLFRDYRVYCLDFHDTDRPAPDRWIHYGPRDLEDEAAWKTMAATMIAGGAVPLAFEPVVLRRHASEYGPLWPDELADRHDFLFTHGDGGTFNNEPLREAMHMIGFMDAGETPDTYDRVLISIDPNVTGAHHDFALDFHRTLDVNPDYGWFDGRDVIPADFAGKLLSNARRVLGALRGQASYKDYLAADKVNHRLEWRDDARRLIVDLVSAVDPDRVGDLADSAESALHDVLGHKKRVSNAPDSALEVHAELRRVVAEASALLAGPAVGADLSDPTTRLSSSLMALLDQVAGLRKKQRVSVFAIAPTTWVPPGASAPEGRNVELAGDFAASFGGFFDRSFRVHDFEVGRAVAGSVLAHAPASGRLEAGLLDDPLDRRALPVPISPDLNTNKYARKRFADRLGFVAESALRSEVANQIVRTVVAPLLRRSVRGLVKAGSEARAPGLLRIVVRDQAGDERGSRYHLRGARGGDDTSDQSATASQPAVLETVVRFSPAGDDAIEGPHVFRRGGGYFVEVCRTRRLRRDEVLVVPLPAIDRLRSVMRFGSPAHETTVDWRDESFTEWLVRDQLMALEDVL